MPGVRVRVCVCVCMLNQITISARSSAILFSCLCKYHLAVCSACHHYMNIGLQKLRENVAAGYVCGDNHDIIDGRPTGSIRISFGVCADVYTKLCVGVRTCVFVFVSLLRQTQHTATGRSSILQPHTHTHTHDAPLTSPP